METQQRDWEVEKILQRGSINNQTHYLVKWVGYPLDEATWEPITNLDNCQHAILNFENSLNSLQKPTRKKSKKKKDMMEIFNRDKPHTRKNTETHLLPDEGSPLKSKQKEMAGVSKEMIQLILAPQRKMVLDDELEFEIVQPIRKDNLNIEEEKKETSQKKGELMNMQRLDASSFNTVVQNKQLVSQIEQSSYLELAQAGPHFVQSQSSKLDKILNEESVEQKYTKQMRLSQQHRPTQDNQESSQKQKKKPKERSRKRGNKHQASKCLSTVAEASERIPTLSEISIGIMEQQIINNKQLSKLCSSGFEGKKNTTVVEVKDPEQLISLLSNPREVQCDHALKAFQRNSILSIIHGGGPQTFSTPVCPLLDLIDAPQILEQLGSVSIVRNADTELPVKGLVRLRHGWYAVGKIQEIASISPVSLLNENSWRKVFGIEKDNQ